MANQSVPLLRDVADMNETGWSVVQAAARAAEQAAEANTPAVFAYDGEGLELRPVPSGDADALIAWRPGLGWDAVLPASDPRRPFLDLYLPICSATTDRPITIGHLGESLDGFIATHAGESQWVTGDENMLHMHRLRALCDAVIVGAGTIAADDPQLTTRLVAGPNPLRVVLDPGRRLGTDHRVFTDDLAETLYVCGRSLLRAGERRVGRAVVVGVEERGEGIDAAEVIRVLRARGCARVFVEGGGVTVSMFLEAMLLDRLHMTVAPVFIGDGRPAIRIPRRVSLGDCPRPRYRVFRMGGDVLFDCDFSSPPTAADRPRSSSESSVTRVI